MKKLSDKIFKIFYWVFTTLVAVVALILIVSLLPIPGNYQIKTVLSGSMEPAIKTGAVVVVKPADNYEKGDVINFTGNFRLTSGKEVTVTHRIVEKNVSEAGVISYVTKGDANDDSDFETVAQRQVIGKVLFNVPYIGYVLETAKKPYGFLALILIPAGLIVLEQIKNIWTEFKKMRSKKRQETSDKQREASEVEI